MSAQQIEFSCPETYEWLMKREGALYPVTYMMRVGGAETKNPDEAFTVVIWRGLNLWEAVSECSPDEFVKRESNNVSSSRISVERLRRAH